jgi:DNA-binding transcriptional LysR family regulator
VDLALLRADREVAPIRLRPLGEDVLAVALPAGHPLLAHPDPLPLALLAEAPMLVLPRAISPAYSDAMTAACRAAGFAPVAVREVGSAMAQLGFVAAGLGVALVSEGMARLNPPGVAFRRLAGPVRGVGVALAWNAERESEAVRLARGIADDTWPRAA